MALMDISPFAGSRAGGHNVWAGVHVCTMSDEEFEYHSCLALAKGPDRLRMCHVSEAKTI